MDAPAIDLHERMPPASPPSILRSAKPSPSPSLFDLPGPAHPIPTPGPGASTTTLYLPIAAPPTPAPSPRPSPVLPHPLSTIPRPQNPIPGPQNPTPTPAAALAAFTALAPAARAPFLAALLSPHTLSPAELRAAAARLAPLLTRDFLGDLPPELALHVLGFVHEPRDLVRAARVCRRWGALVGEGVWCGMCAKWGFDLDAGADGAGPEKGEGEGEEEEPLEALEHLAAYPLDPALQWLAHRARST
ncbi:hypothetical protein HWV62_36344, partial [Athelia sp. TMB]